MNSEQAPESLIKSWLGHSATSSVTDLSDRSQVDGKYRKQIAEQVGIGFEISSIVQASAISFFDDILLGPSAKVEKDDIVNSDVFQRAKKSVAMTSNAEIAGAPDARGVLNASSTRVQFQVNFDCIKYAFYRRASLRTLEFVNLSPQFRLSPGTGR